MKGNVRDIVLLFDGNDKQLIIPVYQRNYDWGEAQCSRLFDDLIEIVQKDRIKHFFGAVVGKPETSFDWIVIDGQQRLTTTSLLMLALADLLDEAVVESKDPELSRKIRRNYLKGAGYPDSETKLKLKPVKHDLDAYRRLLQGDEPKDSSTITRNYRYFRARIAEGELTGDELWTAIQRLEVMALDLEPHDEPQRIFESLNSTGKELKESDKIRNLVLMGLDNATQESLYERYWNEIERNVGFETDTFIRLYLISQTRKTPRFDAVYETFKVYLRGIEEPVEHTLTHIRSYSEHYRDINQSRTGVPAADRRLRRFNLLNREVALPALMPILGDFKAGILSKEEFTRIVILVDSYLFRRAVVGAQSNALNKIFATLYSEARRLVTEEGTLEDAIIYLLRRRDGTSGEFPNDEEFSEQFQSRNFYNFRPQYRSYLFECLENLNSKDNLDIAASINAGDITIEHIMPQTLTKEWREELGSNWEEVHKTWVHRIGNLTVTGYNSEYGNYTFARKKELPGGFESSPYRLNSDVRNASQWDEEAMQRRSHRLLADAIDYWPMIETNFEPVREPLPSMPMGEDNNFNKRTIVSYEFDGASHTVGSFKDLLRGVIRTLSGEHYEKILSYAKQVGAGLTAGSEPGYAGQEEVVPGLWVVTSSSTASKMTLLRGLFRALGFDPNELVIYMRPESEADPEEDTKVKKYVELTKFIPRFDELAGVTSSDPTFPELKAEFFTEFKKHAIPNWQSVVTSVPSTDQLERELSSFDAKRVLAVLTAIQQVDSIMPGTFKARVHDGSLSRLLNRLSQVDVAVT
ncbi:MAG TPA: DUF262 domain-containing protein [Candidatus Corynebacterium gallistercoris]|uniref:DUF262 domain-containing protein n=1 Tax=Candidatus Corynebacterium gallistercoris TaxID=2838530 RepID=A0A9D1UQE2_9CORY|nr:DUF262 domain-containing protein [Candidatus Corynebacterium gallistercoris]